LQNIFNEAFSKVSTVLHFFEFRVRLAAQKLTVSNYLYL